MVKLYRDWLTLCGAIVILIIGAAFVASDPVPMQMLLALGGWLIKVAVVAGAAWTGFLIGLSVALWFDRDVAGPYYAMVTIPVSVVVMVGLVLWSFSKLNG